MKALLQRVTQARIDIDGATIARIKRGLVVMVGVEKCDRIADAQRLAGRLLGYRVFPDSAQRMNLSVMDIGGGVLLVPQFTLAADTRKGLRASFATAAAPELAEPLFDHLVAVAAARHTPVMQGNFGADMQVCLVNDGPVTFSLSSFHFDPFARIL